MTTFNDIQDIWNKQNGPETYLPQMEELIIQAEKNTQKIKTMQYWAIGILGISMLFLSWYAFVYLGLQFSWFHAGLGLMLSALLLRLIAEYRSFRSFHRIDIRTDFMNYTKGIAAFYRSRRKIHYLVTPLAAIAYIAGFTLLLPVFRKSFSTKFFWYIVISGCCLVIVFAIHAIRQTRKEMSLLHFLKGIV